MRTIKTLLAATIAVTALVSLATPAKAQEPKYLHALSNLRAARGWINADHRPDRKDARHDATQEIDRAIDEIKKAAHEDGKSTDFTPPPSAGGDPERPLKSALQSLVDAYADVKNGVDIPANAGLQARAMQHISMARSTVAAMMRQ